AVAIAEDAPEGGASPAVGSYFDLLQQGIGHIGVLVGQIIGHPVPLEHEIARLAAQILDRQARPRFKSCGAADAVDAAEETPHPLPILTRPKLGPAAAAAWKHRIPEAAMDVQRHAVAKQR